MKLLLILSLITLLFGGPVFGPATVWPQSLDELFTLIDTGSGNWVWTNPCPADLPGPVLYWRQARSLHANDEDKLFYLAGLAFLFGDLLACKPPDDKVAFFGPALPGLLTLVDRGNNR